MNFKTAYRIAIDVVVIAALLWYGDKWSYFVAGMIVWVSVDPVFDWLIRRRISRKGK